MLTWQAPMQGHLTRRLQQKRCSAPWMTCTRWVMQLSVWVLFQIWHVCAVHYLIRLLYPSAGLQHAPTMRGHCHCALHGVWRPRHRHEYEVQPCCVQLERTCVHVHMGCCSVQMCSSIALLVHRVLTDTLVPVPSGPGSTDARQMVFEAIQHHILEDAKFPLSSEGALFPPSLYILPTHHNTA